MGSRRMRFAGILTLVAAAIGYGRSAQGQVAFTFEPPTYTTGPLVGQDGWIKNTYYGDMNGTVTVSNSSPLNGAQSINYVETGAGLADVGRVGAIAVQEIQGVDVTLSYTIQATSAISGPNSGVFLGNGAPFGASPILARINGGIVEVGSAGAFVPINSFFFLEGERLKMTYEIDFAASSMNFILENLDFPGAPFSQNYPFFAPYGAPTGPNGEYAVDLGIFFRGGNVAIDDITLTAGVGPIETSFVWAATGSGNWNQTTNWSPAGVPGAIPGRQKVTFGSAITAAQTVYNNAARNLNALEFANSNSYVLAGTGSLAFQADTSGAAVVAPTITVSSGSHQIQLAVELMDNTSVTVAAGASLDFNNQIDLNGNTLTTSGTVRINHTTIGGGAVMSVGSLVAEGVAELGGDLLSTGTLVVSVSETGAGGFVVAGDAVLSGILDVQWDPATTPTTPMTVVSARGALDVSGLALALEDARSFSLGTDGSNLTLTYLGVPVPEPSAAMLALGIGIVLSWRRRLVAPLATSAAAIALLGSVQPAAAVSYNFENPPYVPGNLVGQEGWITPGYVFADPFFGGVLNGNVTVSGSNPLAGAQSALYTQTIDPPAAGNTGASDVSRPNAVFAKKDGSTAIDLTASFQIRTNSNAVGSGSAGFFLGRAGNSPIILLITDASSTAGTGSMIIGDNAAFTTVPYVADNLYEFTIGVDVDNANYEVFSRNITAGTPAQQLTGSGPGGRFVFLGGGYASDGDDQTYTFDTTMLFRSGEARIDSITAVGSDFTEALWGGGSGNWSNNTSWIPNIAPNVPASNAPIAVFGSRITTPQTVFTNSTQTVNGLRFDNVQKYAVAGAGAIALKANTIGGTVNPTVNVLNGSHELQVAVSILDNTSVTVAPGATLDFNNSIALGGKSLTTSGAVNLNVGVTGGGSIVNSGILGTAGTTPIAANLTSTGTLQFDLGAANRDFFNITGNATLSGLVDITLEPGYAPAGSYTLLTASGTLNAAGLALTPADASQFSLSVVGKNLVLTVGGGSFLPGDFNKDGSVNAADLAQWKSDFGVTANSDADNDGDSDGNDFLIWQRNFGQSSAAPAAAGVPEPTSGALTALGALAWGLRRRRSRA